MTTEVAVGWRERLRVIVEAMREVSRQTDPMEMSRVYSQRMRRLRPIDRVVTLSRRDLAAPRFRVTRSTQWAEPINPWKERDRLPLLSGGLFAELLYGDEPRLFDDLAVPADDPARPYVEDMRSLVAVPHFDMGEGLNMTLMMRREPSAFDPEELPEMVWTGNLYGRATSNLVLSQRLREAYEEVDRELRAVADIQRSLLPRRMPAIPTLSLAAHYQTSQRAGGDYYDIFELPGGLWGLLIADVSGHGTPAAVLMAVTHSLAHSHTGPAMPPGALLAHVNRHLAERYTSSSDSFVTAFYGIFDPATRRLTYASAGHNPPRVKRCADGHLFLLQGRRGLPLGIDADQQYVEEVCQLVPGDELVLYTDGITEAQNAAGEMFGLGRLDAVLENCGVGAADLLREVLAALEAFTGGAPPHDDRTLLIGKVR
jgi:sigma-B regulation protein RsbU (phosphoserine phosphatase)